MTSNGDRLIRDLALHEIRVNDAFREGKQVQWYSAEHKKWFDFKGYVLHWENHFYRIKPKSE